MSRIEKLEMEVGIKTKEHDATLTKLKEQQDEGHRIQEMVEDCKK